MGSLNKCINCWFCTGLLIVLQWKLHWCLGLNANHFWCYLHLFHNTIPFRIQSRAAARNGAHPPHYHQLISLHSKDPVYVSSQNLHLIVPVLAGFGSWLQRMEICKPWTHLYIYFVCHRQLLVWSLPRNWNMNLRKFRRICSYTPKCHGNAVCVIKCNLFPHRLNLTMWLLEFQIPDLAKENLKVDHANFFQFISEIHFKHPPQPTTRLTGLFFDHTK